MKLFFEPPRIERIPGITKAWEAFAASLTDSQGAHSVTDNRQLADVIIHTWAAQLNETEARALLRPLSRDDLSRIVWDWEDWPTGRMNGFYCSLPQGLHDSRRHRSVSYPIVFNELVDDFPQGDATLDFGFIGGMNAAIRERLIALLKPTEREDNSIMRAQGGVWSEACVRTANQSKLDYAEFLRRTRFILCPRGYGAGSVRLFETLKAGRVPIIISDRYVPPAGPDWENCSITIKERDIGRIREVVKANLERWPAMAANARAAWEQNFATDKLLPYLGHNIEAMRSAASKLGVTDRIAYSARIAFALADHHLRPKIGYVRKALTDRLAAG
jgi:hypothetical protein